MKKDSHNRIFTILNLIATIRVRTRGRMVRSKPTGLILMRIHSPGGGGDTFRHSIFRPKHFHIYVYAHLV